MIQQQQMNEMRLAKKNRYQCTHLKAVLFDFDGTLTRPDSINFSGIKEAIGCPKELAILEYIETLDDPLKRKGAEAVLNQMEFEAAVKSEPNAGAEELIRFLKSKKVQVGIVTRNGMSPVARSLQNFRHLDLDDFDLVISREEKIRPKPSPDCVYLAMDRWQLKENELILVGDYRFDIESGNAGDIITVLLTNNHRDSDSANWQADYTIDNLADLKPIIEPALPIDGGKLPNRFLHGFLKDIRFSDGSMIIQPGVGEDTAAIDISGEEVMVVKSDPITFVTNQVGHYALTINANDIMTSGALPKWFMATLLFPGGSTPTQILQVMDDLKINCQNHDVILCGGHTEITDAVTRPVVSGTMIGTVKRSGLIDKRRMKPGEKILVTKSAGIEGTAIIAGEFADKLKAEGWSPERIETARCFQDDISVREEAVLALEIGGISAMHDVTEGGIATALEELCKAGRCGLRIEKDKIPVHELTREICRTFGLDPLGLIGSGSLIICCQAGWDQIIESEFRSRNMSVVSIGEVIDSGPGIKATEKGYPTDWPRFDEDEITRLY